MNKTDSKARYVVSYFAGKESEGVESDWIPCYDMTDAVNHKKRIQRQTQFGTVTINKVLELWSTYKLFCCLSFQVRQKLFAVYYHHSHVVKFST